MTRLPLWLVLIGGLGACDGPPAEVQQQQQYSCDAALGKLKNECLVPIDESTEDQVTCDDQQQCAAKCVDNASCEEINQALQGAINPFIGCIDVCAGRPRRPEPLRGSAAREKLTQQCSLELTGICTELHSCFTNCIAKTTCEEIAGHVMGEYTAYSQCMEPC